MTIHHPWARFAVRRLATLLASLWILVTATFLTVHLIPGDPARTGLGPTPAPSQVEARRAALHLDKPLHEQYASYLAGIPRGDFGESFTSRQPVGEIIEERFPATARLALAAFAVALLGVPLGMAIGIVTRRSRHRALADVFSLGTGAMISIPEFLIATGLVAIFGVSLGWLPVAGDDSLGAHVLPVLALASVSGAGLARLARVETMEVLGQQYMTVARGKRLPPRLLYRRHLLPNAVTATLTVGGLVLGGLFASTVVVENVFAWPGLGSAVTQAIIEKDYPLVQGIVLLLGGIALLANTLVDVVLALLNPRSLIRES